jgi:hypothetical protein
MARTVARPVAPAPASLGRPHAQPLPGPWSNHAYVRAAEASGIALILLGVAWYGCSGSTDLGTQVAWLLLAIAAVAVCCIGLAVFSLEGFRTVRNRRMAVMTDLTLLLDLAEQDQGVRDLSDEVTSEMSALPPLEDVRVATSTMSHFHRPDCPMMTGKASDLVGLSDEHNAAGRRPCAVCGA